MGIFKWGLGPLKSNYSKRTEMIFRRSFDKFPLDKVGFWCGRVPNVNTHLGEFSQDLLEIKSI